MRITAFVKFALLGVAVAISQGCMVGPNYHSPATTMPSAFLSPGATTQPAVAVDATQWWKSLNDPELDSLIITRDPGQSRLQIALMHLQQARTFEFVATGAELPDLEASAAAARGSGTNSTKGRISGPLNAGTNTSGLKEITEVAGLDSAWDLDLFGGLRRAVEAAKYDTQAAVEAQ